MNLADLLWRLGRDDAVGVKASPVSPKRVLARAHRKLSVRRAIVFVEVAAVAVVLTAGGFAARAVVQGEEGPPDTRSPSRPRGLVAEALDPNEVRLSWRPSRDEVGVAEYTVYRDGEEVDTVEGTTYSDTEVEPETTYEYEVDAVDEADNRSARSQSVFVTTPATPDTTPPTMPTGLTVSGSRCAPELSWQPSTDDVGVAGYTIYRNGNEAATVDGDTTTYTDPDLPDGDYTYTVEAFDEAGNRSPQSNTEAVDCFGID